MVKSRENYATAVERARCILERYPELGFKQRPPIVLRAPTLEEGKGLLRRPRWERRVFVLVPPPDMSVDEELEVWRKCTVVVGIDSTDTKNWRLRKRPGFDSGSNVMVDLSGDDDVCFLTHDRVSLDPDFGAMAEEELANWTCKPDGYDRVKRFAAAANRYDKELSPALRGFVSDVLDEIKPRPKDTSGPTTDYGLAQAVGEAFQVAFSLLPTKYRNSYSRHKRTGVSACDAVAKAATLCDKQMTYYQVQNRLRQI